MIEITKSGAINYRNEKTGWAKSYAPGSDISSAPREVVDAAEDAWTEGAVDAYRKSVSAPEPAFDDLLEAAYRDAMRRIKGGHASELAAVTDRYPQTERDGWPELVEDAKAGSGGCIQAYADSLGINVSDAATRVMASRNDYRAAWGQATGKLTALRDQADSAYEAGDIEALDLLDWHG